MENREAKPIQNDMEKFQTSLGALVVSLVKLALHIAFGCATILITAWVVTELWGWFIQWNVPWSLPSVETLPFSTAVGLVLIINLLTRKIPTRKDIQEKSTLPFEDIAVGTAMRVLTPLTYWVFGGILHSIL